MQVWVSKEIMSKKDQEDLSLLSNLILPIPVAILHFLNYPTKFLNSPLFMKNLWLLSSNFNLEEEFWLELFVMVLETLLLNTTKQSFNSIDKYNNKDKAFK